MNVTLKFTNKLKFSPHTFWVNIENHSKPFTLTAHMINREFKTVSCQSRVFSARFVLSGKTMASVIGLPVRWSRLKIDHFKQLTRYFSSNSSINRKLNSGQRYWWYLLGGSVCAGAAFKWQQSSTVKAFNPKKMKVSGGHFWCEFIFKFRCHSGTCSNSIVWKITFV